MSRWIRFNPNPSGKHVGDCAIRAISAALDVDWETAYRLIADEGLRLFDVPSSNAVWGAVLRNHGFKRYAIPNVCPDCFTAEQFAEEHPKGVYVLGFWNHTATIRDGVLLDSWNSSQEIPQYYWAKKGE